MDDAIKLINDSKFLKEIKFIDGYKNYLKSDFYKNNLSEVLHQLVYAIDFRSQSFIHLSKNVNQIFGFSYEEMIENGPMHLYKYVIEEDLELLNNKILSKLIDVGNHEKDFEPENLRFAYNFRIKKPNGEIRCLLNRFTIVIYGEHGVPLVLIGTMTDVTEFHDKNELFCEGMRIMDDGTTNKIFHQTYSISQFKNEYNLSKKEIEVLKLVLKGLISKEIADTTNRSIQTIHTHRKNILKKMDCNSMTEVVLIAKDQKWF